MSPSFLYVVHDQIQLLIDELQIAGYRCVGPQVRDGAIVYHTLEDCSQLPKGVSESQSPGHYQLTESNNGRYFSWANGPQAIKPYVFAPKESLWRSQQKENGQ